MALEPLEQAFFTVCMGMPFSPTGCNKTCARIDS